MSETVGDFVLRRLSTWGVKRIYGYPGEGIGGILSAFGRFGPAMQFVQARHEELAAFMACAHAKFTGEVGVCVATSGPGAIHLLNGLYDAKLDHQPVVAIVGQKRRSVLGGEHEQEIDLAALFKDVAHEFVHMVTTPEQVRHLVDRAVRIARDQRAVTCLILPHDVQDLPAPELPPEPGAAPTGIHTTANRVLPAEADLEAAAAILNQGERVAMLVGAGALHAGEEIVQVAERLGAGIAKALLGKAAVPDDLPFVTGAIGLLGTKPSWDLMKECDTLLMVGSGFPYPEFLPEIGQARGIQIDIDARMLSLRYPMELGLVGDSRETLRRLIPHLQPKPGRAWRQSIERNVERWWRVLAGRAMHAAHPINPQRAFWELSPRLPDHCILTCDSGSAANWFARDLKIRRGMMASLSGGLASMGSAIPYAIAAKYAHPDRHVIALLGDGAMQMNGINGLITIARIWHEWGDPRLTIMVLNNRDLNQSAWERRVLEGDPDFLAALFIPDFPYAEYARMLGLGGIRVSEPEAVGAAWEEALSANRPTVVEMVTDPSVPPLPPHLTWKHARAYLSALMHGDPDSLRIATASLKESWESLFPPGSVPG